MEGWIVHKRPTASSPLRTLKLGAATAGSAGAAEFPGLPPDDSGQGRERLVSTAVSTLLHGAILLTLILLAWLNPPIEEELVPVTLFKEKEIPKVEEKADEPAPAPKALAERRLMDFAPQAQAIQPQVLNPSVVARAAPQVNAQAIDMTQVAAVVAPKSISASAVVVEHASAVQSIVGAVASKVDVGTLAAPALRGPMDATLPAGPSVGPKAIAAVGTTVGTGTVAGLGDTSSVRDGVASNRDVLGSPDGAPLANVNTRVGQGFMRGGTGEGSLGGAAPDCLSRPEVTAYTKLIKDRVYARWVLPPESPADVTVTLSFRLEPAGSVVKVEWRNAGNAAIGTSAMEALRSAAPFPPMSDRVRCLAGNNLIATFSIGAASGGQ